MSDYFDYVMGALIGIIVFGLLIALLVAGVEIVQSFRARQAEFVCESHNLEAVRMSFSAKVACIPRTFGADTVHLKTVQ